MCGRHWNGLRERRRLHGLAHSRRQRLIAHSAPDPQCLHRLGHVMDAQDLHALFRRLEREGDASTETLLSGRFARQCTERPLAAGAKDERAAERMEQSKAVHELEIVGKLLSEAEARIDEDALALDARL